MREVSKQWIGYTNQRKQALDEAREKERQAVAVPIAAVARQAAVTLPTLTVKAAEKTANVNYAVPVSKLKKLARELGNINMTYRDVGVKSFDYAYDDLVGRN